MKNYVRSLILKTQFDSSNNSDLIQKLQLLFEQEWVNIVNYPNIYDRDNDDGTFEPLSIENFEVVDLTDDELIIITHGDGQNPHRLTISELGGKLTVIGFKRLSNDYDYTPEELTHSQIINKINY